jgi:PAS domain S-box-containing protein
VAARAAPVTDAQGKVTSAVVVFMDITESRKAEQAVARSEAKYRGLFDSMMDGFVLVDLDGHVIESNQSYRKMLGYSAEELKRKTYVELTPEPWHAFESRIVKEQVLPRGYSEIYEKEYRRKDGSVLPVELRTFQLKEAGVPVAMWAIVRDVTAVRSLQAQLVQSQKLESIGRLAGGVAHDFNNMLGVILGHVELALAQDGAAQQLRDDLQEIQRAARRSADLTKQLLAFARKQTVSPVLLDLNATVASSLQMLHRLLGENVELRWKPSDEPLPIMMDPSQVDQLLTNLCVNARDSIKDVGALTIEAEEVGLNEDYCKAHPEATPGAYVRLVVSDTGCGMDRETLSHLFEPFFTTKAQGQGTGLGLATVHGVVKQNGGFINVYSEPGSGTAFSIYLPRHRGGPGPADLEGTAAPPVRGHETILVVEDEPAILKVTKRMLEGQGYLVLAASTPGEAIQVAREHQGQVQLLLTDVVMPEMNGRTLAKNLLSISPNMKSLFMSGYTADVIAHQGVLPDGVNFLQKPFSAQGLGAAVRKALDG